jgi:tripartite-type tricarboxylate transporter receptor subunit TctC
MPVSVKNIPFDIMDRTFVAVFTASSSVYIVNPNSPVKSMKDLEIEIKKDPDNFTWTANASGYDYAMRRFLKVIGVDVAKTKPVMVKGGTEGVTVTTSNIVKLGFCTASSGGPSIKANLIRPLAIAGDDRHSLLPDVPTMKEAGYANATQMDRFGPSGPAKLPAHIVEIWEKALQEMVKDPSIVGKLEKLGLTVSYQGSRQSRDRVLNELQEMKELYGVK